MIEKIILDFLGERLSVPVSMEALNNEKRYVVIEKTGGSETNYISSATVAIQSVTDSRKGGTLYEAAELNEEVKQAMREIEELEEVSSCSLNADYNFTDTTTKNYRYQAVFNLIHY